MSEIEKLQWKLLTHDEKVQGHYRIKITENMDMHFQWTNGQQLFEEILKSADILERLKSLNGKLVMTVQNLHKFIDIFFRR